MAGICRPSSTFPNDISSEAIGRGPNNIVFVFFFFCFFCCFFFFLLLLFCFFVVFCVLFIFFFFFFVCVFCCCCCFVFVFSQSGRNSGCYGKLWLPLTYNGKNENWHSNTLRLYMGIVKNRVLFCNNSLRGNA